MGSFSILQSASDILLADKSFDRGPNAFGHATANTVQTRTASRLVPQRPVSTFAAEIALERAHLEIAPEVGFDSLGGGDGP